MSNTSRNTDPRAKTLIVSMDGRIADQLENLCAIHGLNEQDMILRAIKCDYIRMMRRELRYAEDMLCQSWPQVDLDDIEDDMPF